MGSFPKETAAWAIRPGSSDLACRVASGGFMFANGGRREFASGNVRIVGKTETKLLIRFGGIAPLGQPFMDLSRFQQRGGLPPGRS